MNAGPATRREVWVSMLLYPRHTLPTAFAPVLVASALAHHEGVFALGPAIAAFVTGWLVQLGGVVTDNYNNLRRHGDDREHPRFVAALRAGTITFRELRLAIVACYLFAVASGLYLVYVGGLPVFIVGVASIVASLAYSSGPLPLGDNFGLGDPLFFVFFGVVSVVATYYAEAAAVLAAPLSAGIPARTVTAEALLASLPIAALTTNILVIDNIRDLEFDRAKNERTLAVLIGPRWSKVEYVSFLTLAYATPFWLYARGGFTAWIFLPLATIPYAALVAGRVFRASTHEELIPMTPQAGQVLLSYAALFAAGLA